MGMPRPLGSVQSAPPCPIEHIFKSGLAVLCLEIHFSHFSNFIIKNMLITYDDKRVNVSQSVYARPGWKQKDMKA